MDELQKYYEYLRKAKADVPDTYESFRNTMQDSASSRKYYEYLRANKFDTPDSYDSFINTFDLKKKEPSKAASLFGGTVGSSVGQSEKEKLTNYLYGLKTGDEKKLAAPVSGITTTLKQKPRKVEEAALNTINTIMYEDSDRWKDPVKSIVDESKKVEKFEDLDVLNKAAELTRSSLAGSGYHSKVLLADTFLGMEKDNMTARMLQDKADKYDKTVQPFRDIRFQYGNQEADAPENDYNAKDKIYDAAIRAYANKNPHFAEQAKAAGIDINESNLSSKFGPKTGFIVREILGDEDFIDYIQNENPKLYNAVKSVSDNLITDQRDFGVNVVANEISKERQKSGFNNPIVEFDDKQFRRENDLVAQRLYADDPQKMKIYQDVISQNPDKYIDTQNLLESFSQGSEGVYKGIGNTFSAPFTPISAQIKDSWKKEAEYVTSDPKGLNKFLSGTGHVLGLVAALGGVNNVLGAGGAGTYSKKVAPFLAGTVPFAGDFWQEGITKYPDSPVKAGLSAGLNTILYGAMSQRIFPAKEVEAAFAKIKPEIGKVVENLATGKITREAARQEAQTLLKQGFELLKSSVTKSAKISAELTAISAANRGLDKLLMGEDEYNQYHPQGKLEENFKALFLDNLVLGGITKYSEMKKGNKMLEESLYEAATNPLRYKRAIDEMEIKDPTINKDDMLSNLGFLSALKMELDNRGISPANQKRYILEAAKERAIKKEMSALPESNLTRRGNEQIERGQEIKNAILRGEEVAKDEPPMVFEEEVLNEKEQAAVDALSKKDFTGTKIEPYTKVIQDPNASVEDKKLALKGLSDQLTAKGTEALVGTELGKEADFIYDLGYPIAEESKGLSDLLSGEIDQQRDLDIGTETVSEPPSISVQMPEEVAKPEIVQPTPQTGKGEVEKDFTSKSGNKVVDEDGNPLKLYHGTSKPLDVFDDSKTKRGMFFTSSKKVASSYANTGGIAPRIISVNIDIKNPHIIDAKGKSYDEIMVDLDKVDMATGKGVSKKMSTDEIVEALKGMRSEKIVTNLYGTKIKADGIIIKNVRDALTNQYGGEISDVYIPFKNEQVKILNPPSQHTPQTGKGEQQTSDVSDQTSSTEVVAPKPTEETVAENVPPGEPPPTEIKPAEMGQTEPDAAAAGMSAFVEVTRPELGFEEVPTDILDNMDSKTMAVQGKRLEGLNKNLSKLQELFNCIWT